MSKTVRVEIETADGKLAILTGEAADVWQSQIDHASSMAVAHGSQFVRLPWVNTTRVEETSANNPMWGLYTLHTAKLDYITDRLNALDRRLEELSERMYEFSSQLASLYGSLKGMILCSQERDNALMAIEVAASCPVGKTMVLKSGALDMDEVAEILRKNGVGEPKKPGEGPAGE